MRFRMNHVDNSRVRRPRPRREHKPRSLQKSPPRVPAVVQRTELDSIAEIAYDYAVRGAYEVARTLYAGLATLEPEDAHHRLGLGYVLDKLDRTREAEEQYMVAARLAPNDPTPLVNRAELRLSRGRGADASILLQKARALCPEHSPVLNKINGMLDILATSGVTNS